jgi:hypothetical protein
MYGGKRIVFSKNRIYDVISQKEDSMELLDNDGEGHIITAEKTGWKKYFKQVK